MNTVSIILKLINEKQITEQKFLSDLGFNRTLLSDWKSGKSKSYNRHLAKIAEYFDVSTDYLLGKTDIKNKPTANKDSELIKAEAELLELFRNVPEENQSLVLEMIEAALKNQGLLK